MFNFLNKKKGEEDSKRELFPNNSKQNSPPKFDFPPPPNPQNNNSKPAEDFAKKPSFKDETQNFGFNNNENNKETQEITNDEQHVSFEIPDFAEEDIDLNINLNNDDSKNNLKNSQDESKDESKDRYKRNELDEKREINLTDNNDETNLEKTNLDDQIEINLDDSNYQIQPDETNSIDDIDFTKELDAPDVKEENTDDDDLPSFDITNDTNNEFDDENNNADNENDTNDLTQLNTDSDDANNEFIQEPTLDAPINDENDLSAFNNEETQEIKTEELPAFNVKDEEKENEYKETTMPKFISKEKYKKIMKSIEDAKEQIDELIKLQPRFPKTENQLTKHFQEITNNMTHYKNKLIEIDKKIFR